MGPPPRSGSRRRSSLPPDLPLTHDEWQELRRALARIYYNQTAAYNLLDRIGFPSERRVPWTSDAETSWSAIFAILDAGLIERPRYRLLSAAHELYPYNDTFLWLAEQYGLVGDGAAANDGAAVPPLTGETAPAPATQTAATQASATESSAARRSAQPPPTAGESPDTREPDAGTGQSSASRSGDEADTSCHVIVRAGSEGERAEAATLLREAGFDPHDVWSTATATSYRVTSADPGPVRRCLEAAGFGWIVVPPGARDYLIGELIVRGPDGRRFRLVDAPAQQTIADIAAGVVEQYGKSIAGSGRPTVMDLILPNGSSRRLPSEMTLEEAGLRDGYLISLGFEATAGVVNPLDHQDALHRMRNQILHFARLHEGITVSGAPPTLPTQYEISFSRRSFGPPAAPDGEPVPITDHTVLIQLSADFPETAPFAFWLTPVFHPNVFPNYESEAAAQFPERQGLVCLGVLSESYTPALDFGDLCRTLIDMAGYRNYSITEPTDELDAHAAPVRRINYYDRAAAVWAEGHLEEILAIGGLPPVRAGGPLTRFRNVIEAADS